MESPELGGHLQHDDLELLLSLHQQEADRVLETPPHSPDHTPLPPSLSDDEGGPVRSGTRGIDMSAFRDVVKDYSHYDPQPYVHLPVPAQAPSFPRSAAKKSTQPILDDKFSGLRIKNQAFTAAELQDKFSDIRFLRLPVIKNLLVGDSFTGCWATIALLTDRGLPKTSSSGKTYCVWRIGSLCGDDVSLFLFGDAYTRNSNEKAGTVFALFNCNVRKDNMGGFSLSIFSPSQILKIGTAADYGTCKGEKIDGTACTLAVNRRSGMYCKYHRKKTSDKYSRARAEVGGRNIRMAYRDHLRSEGIYVVDPISDRRTKKEKKPVKLLSVDGLKKALSKAGGVTTSAHSQGIRFLTQVTDAELKRERLSVMASPHETHGKKREHSTAEAGSSLGTENQQQNAKKVKAKGSLDSSCKPGYAGLIELEIFSSGDEL
ncbi:hypothetical protein MLD38_006582 [Melastoma candidum]|uniref:Uncharacterized protein n=1 Tax=Melastoma candidum TaxID=119954 RepID=A0ACB9RMW9_9MYRT|nr:hypothetical protein MLD38_006582 [Melastoma candidum]